MLMNNIHLDAQKELQNFVQFARVKMLT